MKALIQTPSIQLFGMVAERAWGFMKEATSVFPEGIDWEPLNNLDKQIPFRSWSGTLVFDMPSVGKKGKAKGFITLDIYRIQGGKRKDLASIRLAKSEGKALHLNRCFENAVEEILSLESLRAYSIYKVVSFRRAGTALVEC